MSRISTTERVLFICGTTALVVAIIVTAWTRIGGRDAAEPAGQPTVKAKNSSARTDGSSAYAATPSTQTSATTAPDAPPPLGPGAGVPFDPATAPIVPAGMSTDEYVTAYFNALMAQEWATAAAMVPKVDPAQTPEQFVALLGGYRPESFAITESADVSDSGKTVVFIFTPDEGAWNIEWEWAQTSRGLAVKDVRYSRPGYKPCH